MLGDHEMVGIPSKRKVCQEAAGLFEPGIGKRKRHVTLITGIRSTLAEAQAFQKKPGNHANYKRKRRSLCSFSARAYEVPTHFVATVCR